MVLLASHLTSCRRSVTGMRVSSRVNSCLSGNKAGNTQHGTTAKGLPNFLAKSTMLSVASSGCIPSTTLQSANLCQLSGVNMSRTCWHNWNMGSVGLGRVVSTSPMSTPHIVSSSSNTPSSKIARRALLFRVLSHLCCALFSFRGRGSTSVHVIFRLVCSSKLTSPRPPATSKTPEPRDKVSTPKVSTSHLTKTSALFALVLAPPPSACGSPSSAASSLRRRLRSEIHAVCVSRDAWA